MKKKIVIVGAIIIVIAALFAMCGGDGNSNDSVSSLKPDGVELKGDLKGCFEVVDKEYKLLEDGLYPVICVELKRTSTALPFNPNAGSFSYSTFTGDNGEEIEIGFGYELLDENNNVVHTTQPGEYSSYDVERNDIEPLMKLNPGETGTLRMEINTKNKPVKFRLLSSLSKSNATEESTSVTSSSESTGTSNDWDAVLDEYEEYIDDYIKFYKKAQTGDMSAMTEYASMLEKAESLSKKLEKAQDDLTASQAARFLKLQQKLTNAVL